MTATTKTYSFYKPDLGSTVPPFMVRFSTHLKGGSVLGVIDEEGFITLLNTSHGSDKGGILVSWEAHKNSIFDMKWFDRDCKIATASGDQSVRLWDVEREKCFAQFNGHTGSVKAVDCKSNSRVFATCSRDGNVLLWDIRQHLSSSSSSSSSSYPTTHQITPFMVMMNVHSISRHYSASSKHSVTSLAFLKAENILATGGAADGKVKLWDLRFLNKRSPKALLVLEPGDDGEKGGEIWRNKNGTKRNSGISSLSTDSTGTRLLVGSIDHTLSVYDMVRAGRQPPLKYQGHVNSSFYVKATFSPNDEYILSGSSDNNVYIWEVAATAAAAVVVVAAVYATI
eukprot:jgi/Bigna1/144172/aug1.85_g18880